MGELTEGFSERVKEGVLEVVINGHLSCRMLRALSVIYNRLPIEIS